MSIQVILLPVFVQVGLIFFILSWMARQRFVALKSGVAYADIALGERVWPPRAQQAANSYLNQFEIPVLFFALVPLAIITRKADLLFVALEWLFVLSRIAHAYVHLGRNYVPIRGPLFGVGALILMAMWIVFALRILLLA